jgi:hypothetical protein
MAELGTKATSSRPLNCDRSTGSCGKMGVSCTVYVATIAPFKRPVMTTVMGCPVTEVMNTCK